MIKSPILYVGSKQNALQHLIFPENRSLFVDVFGGSGVVTMNNTGKRVYNDIDPALVAFMTMLQEDFETLIQKLELYPYAREVWEYCRDHNSDPLCWYIWLQYSHMCAGEGWGREFSKPNSKADLRKNRFPLFGPAHFSLQRVELLNEDYQEVLLKYDSKDTVFYLDPPYQDARGNYGKISHKKMLDLVFTLKGYVMVSGYTSELYKSYPWSDVRVWDRVQRIAQRYTQQKVFEYVYIKEAK